MEMDTEITINQPETPLVGRRVVSVKPMYIWKDSKVFRPSKKEYVVLEAYVKNWSFREAGKALKEYMPWRKLDENKFTALAKRWLETKDQMIARVGERLEERAVAEGWTKERWILIMTEHLQGKKRLASGDLYGMKLMSSIKGWDMPEGMNFNQTFNITQADGRE